MNIRRTTEQGRPGLGRQRGRRRGLLATLTVAALAATVAFSSGASANDGRAVSPKGELNALYIHGLDRAPDQGGWNTYISMINGDCRWNLLRASYDILTSPEAANRWRTPQNLVGALYAALLNRAPDPGGFTTYVNLTNARGFPSAVVSVLASAEYKNRAAAICAGLPGPPASMVSPDNGFALAAQTWNASKALAASCAFGVYQTFSGPLSDVFGGASTLKRVWDGIHSVRGGEQLLANSCGAWYQVLLAVTYADNVSNAGYFTFWREDGIDVSGWPGPHNHCTNWIRIGTDPSHWNTYTLHYDCDNNYWPF